MPLITEILLDFAFNDLDHPFHAIDPLPNMPQAAEHLHPTAEDHHLADAHHHHVDVIDRTLRNAPEPLLVLLVATKLYLHQQHVLQIQDLLIHPMQTTPGAIGMSNIIEVIIAMNIIDLVLRQFHHVQPHLLRPH